MVTSIFLAQTTPGLPWMPPPPPPTTVFIPRVPPTPTSIGNTPLIHRLTQEGLRWAPRVAPAAVTIAETGIASTAAATAGCFLVLGLLAYGMVKIEDAWDAWAAKNLIREDVEPGPHSDIAMPGGLRLPPRDAGVSDPEQGIPIRLPEREESEPVALPANDFTSPQPTSTDPDVDKFREPQLFPGREDSQPLEFTALDSTPPAPALPPFAPIAPEVDPALEVRIYELMERFRQAQTNEQRLVILDQARECARDLVTWAIEQLLSHEDLIHPDSPFLTRLSELYDPLAQTLADFFTHTENTTQIDDPEYKALMTRLAVAYQRILTKGELVQIIIADTAITDTLRTRLHFFLDGETIIPLEGGGGFLADCANKELGEYLVKIYRCTLSNQTRRIYWDEQGHYVIEGIAIEPIPDPYSFENTELLRRLGWNLIWIETSGNITRIIFDMGDKAHPPDPS